MKMWLSFPMYSMLKKEKVINIFMKRGSSGPPLKIGLTNCTKTKPFNCSEHALLQEL
jgi:hypothetical protein